MVQVSMHPRRLGQLPSLHIAVTWCAGIAFMCMSPGPERLAILQEQWSECNGHWSESTFYKQLKQETRLRRKGCRRWLTHAELKLKYGDCDVAQSIVDQKELEDPEATGEQVRPHPDCAKVPCPLVCI